MAEPESNTPPRAPAGAQGAGPQADAPSRRSPLEQSVLAPIPGKSPTGNDPAYDDDFLRIKAEIDRLGTVTGKVDQQKVMQDAKELESVKSIRNEKERAAALAALRQRSVLMESAGPEYGLVIDLATRILTEKSKDIRVACYLCLALWRKQRIAGMAEGLSVILLLVLEYWDAMFPAQARVAVRKGALDFLIQRLADELKGSEVAPDDRLHLERAKSVVGSLEQELSGRMGENAPALGALAKAVEDGIARLPKPSAPLSQIRAGAGVQADPAQSAAGVSADGELKSLQGAVDLVRKVSAFLRGQDRKSVAPFRLMRSMRWDALQGEPPNENGKTKIEAPPAPRRTYFAGLKQNGLWDKLLEEGETTFAQPPFHFWLDLQQLIVSALEGLGSEYGAARMAVLQDLAILHGRLPKLSLLVFADGTPFASPATRSWLEGVVLPVLGGGGSAPSSSPSGGDTRLAVAFDEARRLVDRGDLVTAIASLQAIALPPRSRRAQFERRLDVALLCVRGNQVAMARPVLEELNEEIDRSGLGEWDPPLVLDTWKTLERCYQSLAAAAPGGGKQALVEQAGRIFEKICRLDVNYALAMAGAKPGGGGKPASVPEPARAEAGAAQGGEGGSADVKEKAVPAPGG
jgi:type VI secretion system protein VasJ